MDDFADCSARALTALEGADVYCDIALAAPPKFTILPGSGLNATTLPEFIKKVVVPVREVHLTAGARYEPEYSPQVARGEVLGFGHDEWRLDVDKLRAVRDVLDSL